MYKLGWEKETYMYIDKNVSDRVLLSCSDVVISIVFSLSSWIPFFVLSILLLSPIKFLILLLYFWILKFSLGSSLYLLFFWYFLFFHYFKYVHNCLSQHCYDGCFNILVREFQQLWHLSVGVWWFLLFSFGNFLLITSLSEWLGNPLQVSCEPQEILIYVAFCCITQALYRLWGLTDSGSNLILPLTSYVTLDKLFNFWASVASSVIGYGYISYNICWRGDGEEGTG